MCVCVEIERDYLTQGVRKFTTPRDNEFRYVTTKHERITKCNDSTNQTQRSRPRKDYGESIERPAVRPCARRYASEAGGPRCGYEQYHCSRLELEPLSRP